jgi:hypothetical protein
VLWRQKTHYTESQNSDTTAPSGRELYHLQFSLQAASSETFGYIVVDGFVFRRYKTGHEDKHGLSVSRDMEGGGRDLCGQTDEDAKMF